MAKTLTRESAIRALMATGMTREDASRELDAAMEPADVTVRKDANGHPVVERVDKGRARRMG